MISAASNSAAEATSFSAWAMMLMAGTAASNCGRLDRSFLIRGTVIIFPQRQGSCGGPTVVVYIDSERLARPVRVILTAGDLFRDCVQISSTVFGLSDDFAKGRITC